MKKILLLTTFICLFFSSFSQRKAKVGYSNVRTEDTAFVFRKQSMLTMSVYDLFFTNVTLNYEFFRKDGQMGFQLPLSINAGGLPDSTNYDVQNVGPFISQKNGSFKPALLLIIIPMVRQKCHIS